MKSNNANMIAQRRYGIMTARESMWPTVVRIAVQGRTVTSQLATCTPILLLATARKSCVRRTKGSERNILSATEQN